MSNESFTPIYYGQMVFVVSFNGGARAVDLCDLDILEFTGPARAMVGLP